MLFNSLQYVIFLPLVVMFYYLIPHKYRWAMLLAASYYFYMCWNVSYVLLILSSTLVDYIAGRSMAAKDSKLQRRIFLIFSLVANLGLLFTFKYYNFFADNINHLLADFNIMKGLPELKVLLPVGISFYTFQSLSYTLDIYFGNREAEKHFGIFALYVSFFPQLVAGPIERSERLLPQFREKHMFSYRNASDGLKLILWGFFKKLVIADRLSMMVDTVYKSPGSYNGFAILLATYFFSFQIYCDFSGYSDIARGSARLMGFDLMENFRRPYFAANIKEFWQRWHISLSTWFRDYVYIPLGGNRVKALRHNLNISIVFLTCALWHGANWTFIVWGALHSLYYIITHYVQKLLPKKPKGAKGSLPVRLFKIVLTFHLATFAWIFFRANSVKDAFVAIKQIFSVFTIEWDDYWGMTTTNLMLAVIALIILFAVHFYQEKYGSIKEKLLSYPLLARYAIYISLIVFIMSAGLFTNDEFIYFQF